MIKQRIKKLEYEQLTKQKKAYDALSGLFMISTIILVLFSIEASMLSLLLTTLSLASSNAVGNRLMLVEVEMQEEVIEKYIKDE
jgi:flagellar biosynthesis/type III secretory pathway M-ring protein FliF/YscJ